MKRLPWRPALVALLALAALAGGRAQAARAADPPPPPRPVLFLPGTLGTYLRNDDGLLWVKAISLQRSGDDSWLDPLQLAPDGESPAAGYSPAYVDKDRGVDGVINTQFKVCAPIEAILLPFPFNLVAGHCKVWHQYDLTFQKLHDLGYRYSSDPSPDQTLWVLGYDWRKSMVDNARLVEQKIDQIRRVTGATKVDILAHSQGGLVTNFYLHYYGTEKVKHVVTMGTPYLGTPKFLSILEYGTPCEVGSEESCKLNRNEVQKLVNNFPGSLELLPSPSYFTLMASPWIERFIDPYGGVYKRKVYNYLGMRDKLIADGHNADLLRQSGGVHTALDTAPLQAPIVKFLRIAGTRRWTLNRVQVDHLHDCQGLYINGRWAWPCRQYLEIKPKYATGDGTVVAPSAKLINCATGAKLDWPNSWTKSFPKIDHNGLAQSDAVLRTAVSFFRNGTGPSNPCANTQFLRRSLKTVHRRADDGDGETDPGAVDDADPGSDDALSGTELQTFGPLVGYITDGNEFTGSLDPDGQTGGTGIDGSSFNQYDGGATYSVSDDAPSLTGSFRATEAGTGRIQLHLYGGGSFVQTVVSPNLELQQGTVVTIAYGQPTDASLLQVQIDDNGDGTVDRTVPFLEPTGTAGAEDETPPTSIVHVVHYLDAVTGKRMVTVTVDASDEGGAGVGQIQWRTTTGEHGVYTEPLTLRAQGEIAVTAMDRAGNVQGFPSWGVLDDHAGIRQLVDQFDQPHLNAPGYMDFKGDVDWWGFDVSGGRTKFMLVGMGGNDYDLTLTNADGDELATSAQRGSRSEKITMSLAPGRYYVEVTGFDGAFDEDHPYRLNVNQLGG